MMPHEFTWLVGASTTLGVAWAIGMSGAVIGLMVKVSSISAKLDDLISLVKKNGVGNGK